MSSPEHTALLDDLETSGCLSWAMAFSHQYWNGLGAYMAASWYKKMWDLYFRHFQWLTSRVPDTASPIIL